MLLPSSHCSRSAVTGSRPGVDHPHLADVQRARRGGEERLALADAARLDHVGLERVGERRVHDHGVAVDHRADGVEVHRRAVLGDRDREHGVRRAGQEQPLGERLDPGRARALADADGEHAGREHEHVAALEPRLVGGAAAVEQLGAGEARVVAVDRAGDGALAPARRHRELGHGDAVLEPDRRVAGEHQVRQRPDHERLRLDHVLDEPAGVDGQLLARHPRHQHPREVGRGQRAQVLGAAPARAPARSGRAAARSRAAGRAPRGRRAPR